jgi:hypothetical protein
LTYQNGNPHKGDQQGTAFPSQDTKPAISTGEIGIAVSVITERTAIRHIHDPIKDGRKQTDAVKKKRERENDMELSDAIQKESKNIGSATIHVHVGSIMTGRNKVQAFLVNRQT